MAHFQHKDPQNLGSYVTVRPVTLTFNASPVSPHLDYIDVIICFINKE